MSSTIPARVTKLPSSQRMRVATAVDAFRLSVYEFDRVPQFFRDAMGFSVKAERREQDGHRIQRLQLGGEYLEIAEIDNPSIASLLWATNSNDTSFQHVAIVVTDIEQAYRHLSKFGVHWISPAPVRLPDWNPCVAGIRAAYFKIASGHACELIQYPPGKGDARWQSDSDALFIGIDHSAITVRSTAESVAFYVGQHGMRVTSTSENYGPEQEGLTGVPIAHVRITQLRASTGPGIEFLEYDGVSRGHIISPCCSPETAAWKSCLTVKPDASEPHPTQCCLDPDGHCVELFQETQKDG